jgi:hypothetical protein
VQHAAIQWSGDGHHGRWPDIHAALGTGLGQAHKTWDLPSDLIGGAAHLQLTPVEKYHDAKAN